MPSYRQTAASLRCFFVLVAALLGELRTAAAGDWPQHLGPQRSGVASDELAPDTLASPPQELWSFPLGQGYAGAAVLGDTAYVWHRVENQERLVALDVQSGRLRWQADFPSEYQGGVDPDVGPRCVPTVVPDANLVLVFGAAGGLHAVKLSDGRTAWTRDLFSDYGAPEGYFGAGSAPLVVGDRVLVNVGGRGAAGIIALQLKSGRELWKAVDEEASYSAPIVLSGAGTPRAFFVTRYEAMLIDPSNGHVFGKRRFGQRGPTVNAATPIDCDGEVFVTASYGVGAALLRLDNETLEPRWANDASLSSQYNTPIYRNGYLYGIHGREDAGAAELRCIEAKTGRVHWHVPDFGVAHLVLLEDRLLILKVNGELLLVRANPERYELLANVRVSRHTTRALPAVSQGRLYVRENEGPGGRLICLGL